MSAADRTRALAAVLLAALVLLGGCVNLPRSGPVTASNPDLPPSEGIGLFAAGPREGASPQEIVEGFLTASAAGYSDEFLVARQFLAGTAVQTWQPLEQVRIYADNQAPEFSRTDDGAVRLTVAAQASVDSAGHYTESPPQTTIEAQFSLARTAEGEWRIIELDDGVLLPAANFTSLYSQRALYFLTPEVDALVPDVRWYPQENQATALVRGLLEGPSQWLAPGVVTMVPAGTRMTVEAVTVTDGVARVDLSADALSATPAERAALYAQLERTLLGVPGVQLIQITAAGAPYEVAEDIPELSAYPYTTTNLVVVSDGALAEVVGEEIVPLPGGNAGGITARHPAVGYDPDQPVMVLLDGTDRLVTAPVAQAQSFVLAQGSGLVAPSVDIDGWVWTSPARSAGDLVAVRASGEQVAVDVPWLDGAEVHALRISREGARAVVVWEAGGRTSIDVAAVVRGLDGVPRSLAEPVRIGERMTSASDVAWVDDQTVAVLGTSEGDAAPVVHLLPIGGPTTRLPVVEGAVSITAGRGDRSLVVGTDAGRLYERNGASWRPVLTDAYDPALPG